MVSFTKLFTAGLVATSAIAAPMQAKRTTSGKRGAAYNDISTVSPLASAGTISWAYNWAGSLSGSLPSDVEFVPMLWGTKMFSDWVTAIEAALSGGSTYILGFNEPDMSSQANMTPAEAAAYYLTYITPWSGDAKLISPAVTSSTETGVGLDWFESFIGDCSDCGITGLAVHWYGDDADDFKTFVTNAVDTASTYGLTEVWITEFALSVDVNGSADLATTTAFLDEVIPWLDEQTGVTRYSYFMCAEDYLLTSGSLNDAGTAYVSAANMAAPYPQPQPAKNWPHSFDKLRLGIPNSHGDQQTLHDIAQAVYDIVAADAINKGRNTETLFRSSSSRTEIQFEWRRRLARLPAAVRAHVPDINLLTGALYKYVNCIQDELKTDFEARQQAQTQPAAGPAGPKTAQQPAGQPTVQQAATQPTQQQGQHTPQQKKFDYWRPYIVPNGDVQIIRADHPEMPIAIRLSDFLTDKGDPRDICPDGDWINIANIKFDTFKQNLTAEGYLRDEDTLWLNHLSLEQMNPATTATPQPGEVRLTSFNLASTLLRIIREHWPKLRNPSPDPFRGSRRSPLPRPNLTIIIRSGAAKGGALGAKQPALSRPPVRLGGTSVIPNRRTEQVARYAAQRHAKTKRKRAEAEGEADVEGETEAEAGAGAETEVEGAPPTQKRKVTATTATPGIGLGPAPALPSLVPDPAPGFALGPPAFGPAAAFDPAGVPYPAPDPAGLGQEGNDDDSSLLALLDPTMFNTEGLVVGEDDSAALQEFFEGNAWAGEPMEED
ncbi:unnamed protein product [Penicillium glandicola]